MKEIKKIMFKYPTITMALMFPFSLVFTLTIFSIIMEIIMPILFAAGMTYWIYNWIIGRSIKDNIQQPFTYINTKFYSG